MPDKKRPAILVRYEFATPEAREARKLPPGARLATADARTDPEYVRNMVAEIIGTLRDEHSMGFYVSVVRALPEEVLRNVLGGTRQAIREGLTIELARKTFTASAKARAKAISVPL